MNEEELNVEEEEEHVIHEPSVEEEEEEKVDPRTLLTETQLRFFTQLFETLDTDRKERVPVKVMGYVLRLMGLNPSKADIKDLMKELDPSNKGVIDFPTFLLPIAQRINEEGETHEDIIAAFKVLDEEGNGYIQTDFLTESLTGMAEDLDDLEMELLLKMADPKGTGKINYVEFVEKIMGVKQAKKEKDKTKGGKKGGKKKKKK